MTLTIESPPAGVAPPPPRKPKASAARPPGRPPRPPRRVPKSMVPRAPFTNGQLIARASVAILAAVLAAFIVQLTLVSHVQHFSAQQQLANQFKEELAAGTAPVSEGDFNNVLLPDGAPVGLIDIPALGLHEVIVEGTAAAQLDSGPGHRRDTVLPGQIGVSVIMARAAAYGGPFGRLQELAPGTRFTVITGQGEQIFTVLGVRYAGDPSPPAVKAGESRLILETARGAAFVPTGIARVDAQLISDPQPSGARQTTFSSLPAQQKSMATDTTQAWALVFALQFFIAVEIAAVWAYRRLGAQKTWVVFLPLVLLAGLLVADQINRFLPNLM